MLHYKLPIKKLFIYVLILFSIALVWIYYNFFRHLIIPPTPLSSFEFLKAEAASSENFTLSSNFSISTFDLGSSSFTDPNGNQINFPIQGTIGIPASKSSSLPVVFIFPGYKDILSTSSPRLDLGFNYLVQELASNGYIALSLNIPPSYLTGQDITEVNLRLDKLFNTHLNFLYQAFQGNDVGYPFDLKNIGDLSDISFISHSFNAESIYYIAQKYSSLHQFNLSGLLFIAPSYISTSADSFLDIPTSIILPQLDGCVVNLDGQSLYNDLSISPNRCSFTQLTYLYGANHNFFNSTSEQDDSVYIDTSSEINNLTAHDQRDFLANFALDFLRTLSTPSTATTAFNPSLPSPNSLYGCEVLTSLTLPDRLTLLSPLGPYSESLNNLGGDIKSKNSSLSYVVDSYLPTKDTAGAFSLPGNPLAFPLLRMSWNVPSGTLTITIPPKYKDISSFSSLSLNIGLDPTNMLNPPNSPQSFIIELKDTYGKSERILIDPSSTSMRYQPGVLMDNTFTSYWSTFTPISDLRIPLSLFTHINLSNISSISLIFNQTPSGSLMLNSISLLGLTNDSIKQK